MLPSYFDYVFVHLRHKARLRPELSLKFLSTLGPNPGRARPEKPGRIYNSACAYWQHSFFPKKVAKMVSRWQHCV